MWRQRVSSLTRPITYTQWKLKKVPRVTTDDKNTQSRQDLITVTKEEDMESTMEDIIGDFMTCLKTFKWHAYNTGMVYIIHSFSYLPMYYVQCFTIRQHICNLHVTNIGD